MGLFVRPPRPTAAEVRAQLDAENARKRAEGEAREAKAKADLAARTAANVAMRDALATVERFRAEVVQTERNAAADVARAIEAADIEAAIAAQTRRTAAAGVLDAVDAQVRRLRA